MTYNFHIYCNNELRLKKQFDGDEEEKNGLNFTISGQSL